jgi:DNA-binding MarR family transcriptional regulator
MLQRREKAGFVERWPDPEDRRVSRVYLTEAGSAVRISVQ